MTFSHTSVLPGETIAMLSAASPEGIYVDATLGGGGHAELLLEALPGARLIGIDRDENAIRAAGERLARFGERFSSVRGNFHDIAALVPHKVNGILMDLGVSSHQLDEAERGFSYREDAPLDMRMDQGQARSAYDVVNTMSQSDLARILRDYGEERFSGRIARRIVENRPIETTMALAQIVTEAIPAATRRTGGHPARRSFQAIRIEVNGELDGLEQSIRDAVSLLLPGGRLCIITFHSLEDRIVKQTFANMANPCTCPPKIPVCICGKKPVIRLVNRKPIIAAEAEMEENPRARSAKLRGAERLPQED